MNWQQLESILPTTCWSCSLEVVNCLLLMFAFEYNKCVLPLWYFTNGYITLTSATLVLFENIRCIMDPFLWLIATFGTALLTLMIWNYATSIVHWVLSGEQTRIPNAAFGCYWLTGQQLLLRISWSCLRIRGQVCVGIKRAAGWKCRWVALNRKEHTSVESWPIYVDN